MKKNKNNDTFELFDLKVTVKSRGPMVCSHTVGDSFEVRGENIILPKSGRFSMYALAALLPLLPAKQRVTDAHDWMTTDTEVACPDPHCGALFEIKRLRTRTFKHSDVSAVPLR